MKGHPPGAIWPANDDEAVQIREVLARYGLAMYQAQVLEHCMVNAVIVFRMLPTMGEHPHQVSWEEAVDRVYDSELAKTFGNMLRALETLPVPDDLMKILRHAKIERDRLAHRFFREHDENFLGPSGRTKMIADCEEMIELFSAIDAELEAVIAPQSERYGITKELMENHFAAALAAAKAKGDTTV